MMKTASSYKSGEMVQVYEDPITEQRPEGRFVLGKHLSSTPISTEEQLERWQGRFEGDEMPLERTFKTRRHGRGGEK